MRLFRAVLETHITRIYLPVGERWFPGMSILKYMQVRKETTRYVKRPWVMTSGVHHVTFRLRYDSAERKLVVATSDLALVEAPVDAKRADVEALYRERVQR